MNAFKVLAFFALVAVAASVTIKGCASGSGSYSLDWDTCTKQPDGKYGTITLLSGSLDNGTAYAFYKTFSDSNCTSQGLSVHMNCTCGTSQYDLRLECGAAAGVIPSVLLIIAAIMAHLF
eukprot:TRINITY_DN5527_c0_g2_i1.p2 TRINITY_DN5527_c0_g2~~TRINITY_DN5527_c0_g2_i1.p2  ORF type:complete len:141 (+),score=32.40 TRINITY_DN5527_c0_g2_i1:64-423(+)